MTAANDNQTDAVGRVYAVSLVELAEAQGGKEAIEGVLAELEELAELAAAQPQFVAFLRSQSLSAERRGASLDTILKGRVSELTRRFLLVLNSKGRIDTLESVIAAVGEIVQERFGRVEVDIFTAAPLDRAGLDAVAARLCGVLGKEPVLHPYVEPGMLGGLRIRVGDQLVDASVSARLEGMRDALGRGGAGSVRAGMGRFLGEN